MTDKESRTTRAILSLDGGGVRGVIALAFLERIEAILSDGQPAFRLADHFDLIGGTSTGAIIACALTKPRPLSAGQIARIYLDEGPEIFSRTLIKQVTSVGGLFDERYESDGLLKSLRKHFDGHRYAGKHRNPFTHRGRDRNGYRHHYADPAEYSGFHSRPDGNGNLHQFPKRDRYRDRCNHFDEYCYTG